MDTATAARAASKFENEWLLPLVDMAIADHRLDKALEEQMVKAIRIAKVPGPNGDYGRRMLGGIALFLALRAIKPPRKTAPRGGAKK